MGACSSRSETSLVHDGAIDLRNVDLSHQIMSLDGEWLFYWGQLLNPNSLESIPSKPMHISFPGAWTHAKMNGSLLPKQGMGTFVLHVHLDSSKNTPLVIATKEINASSKIWINGSLMPDIGDGRLYEYLPAKCSELVVVAQVTNSNDPEPGFPYHVLLGSAEEMRTQGLFYFGMQALQVGLFGLFASLYLTSWFMRKRDRSILYLALYSICWAVYACFQGMGISPAEVLFPNISMHSVQQGFLVTTVLANPLICSFWLELFPTSLLRRLNPAFIVLSLAYCVVILCVSQTNWDYFIWFLVISNSFMLVLWYSVIMAVRRKDSGARVFLVGLLGFNIFVAYSSLAFRGDLMAYGALILLLADALLLSRRQAQAALVVQENQKLREALAGEIREKFSRRVMSRRVEGVLQLVEEPLFATDESGLVCFSNLALQREVGYTQDELQGMDSSALCVIQPNAQSGTLQRANGTSETCAVRQETLALDDESVQVFFVQFPGCKTGEYSAIGNSMEQAEAHESGVASLEHGVELMVLTLQVWEQCAGLTKADFAEASGLWKAHVDHNGWRRTATLDKYLALDTIPRLPKWQKIIDSAEFALVTASHRRFQGVILDQLKILQHKIKVEIRSRSASPS